MGTILANQGKMLAHRGRLHVRIFKSLACGAQLGAPPPRPPGRLHVRVQTKINIFKKINKSVKKIAPLVFPWIVELVGIC